MKRSVNLFLLAAGTLLFAGSCSKDKDLPDVDDNELITSCALTFTNVDDPKDVVKAKWADPDGEGGKAPVVDAFTLKASSTYKLVVSEMKGATANDNVLDEIKERMEEHLFHYVATPAGLLTVNATDMDANKLPVGLENTVTTGKAGNGKLNVLLYHQPKVKDGVRYDQPGSSTDLDITFSQVSLK